MASVCFYFQVHQPYRLNKYSVFDIGTNKNYFCENAPGNLNNKNILKKVADKCYIPANKKILELIKNHPEFKASYSLSGTVLDQFQEYYPEVLTSFQELVDTGNVEILSETYHHSLSFLFSKKEFREQVLKHKNKVKKLFNKTPGVFRNTELVFNNEVAKHAEEMGYKGVLAEGADHILGWRSPNFVYTPYGSKKIKVLLKNYRLSDDIAFRFSEKNWSGWPLTADKFSDWVHNHNGNGNTINLFMDYETFGEHQWESTGIFNFLEHLPKNILKNKDNNFKTPSEIIREYKPVGEVDFPYFVSWADIERDLSAWLGNPMQNSAINTVYSMEKHILESGDEKLIEDWRKLQTSDNFYYMCTKWFSDGDVHKYFNPYSSPYEAFINYMNILTDLRLRLKSDKIKNIQKVY